MKLRKHIAMWSCPRSRSTVITRAFEQLPGSMIFDEPFFGSYLVHHGYNNASARSTEEVAKFAETDYRKVIQKITGDLPDGVSFSFQKHQA